MAKGVSDEALGLVAENEVNPTTQVNEKHTSTKLTEGPKKRKARGLAKGVHPNEAMRLEYNHLGQPCGKWRAKYGTHLGLCMRKLSIVKNWDEIDRGLKKALWQDTVVSVFVISFPYSH